MKKYGIYFVLFVMCNIHAMKMPVISYYPSDEQCLQVALYLNLTEGKIGKDIRGEQDRKEFLSRDHVAVQKVNKYLQIINEVNENTKKALYFLKSIPSIETGDLASKMKGLEENVRFTAGILSQSNMLVFLGYNQDVFTAICKIYLPKTFEDTAGFFNEKSNTQVRIIQAKESQPDQVLSKAEMIQKLQRMPFGKALYVLAYVAIPKSPPSEARWDRVQISSSLAKMPTIIRIPAMSYHWTHEDCENLTVQQIGYLDEALRRSNDNKRCLITEAVVGTLRGNGDGAVKKFILGNKKYGTVQIKVDISPSTPWERRKNKFLYWLPHALVMIVPNLVQSQINGIWHNAASVVVCAAGSLGFGEYLYPWIDSWNSDVDKFSQWYGPKNHTKKRAGRDFVFLSIIHSVANLTAQKFLSWQAMPWKILGGGIHAIRAFLSYMLLIENEKMANKNPFNRRNEAGVPFMLKDLADGPKFDD